MHERIELRQYFIDYFIRLFFDVIAGNYVDHADNFLLVFNRNDNSFAI